MKEERVAASPAIKGKVATFRSDKQKAVMDLRAAPYAAKLVSDAQGCPRMRAAARMHNWNLSYGGATTPQSDDVYKWSGKTDFSRMRMQPSRTEPR